MYAHLRTYTLNKGMMKDWIDLFNSKIISSISFPTPSVSLMIVVALKFRIASQFSGEHLYFRSLRTLLKLGVLLYVGAPTFSARNVICLYVFSGRARLFLEQAFTNE